MTEKEFLDKLRYFVNGRLSSLEKGTIRIHPMGDLDLIKNMIDEFLKEPKPVDNNAIHPNAIQKLSTIKVKNKEMEQKTNLEIELVNWNICPKCGSNLSVTFSRWWQFSKPWCTKTCTVCENKFNRERPYVGTGPR